MGRSNLYHKQDGYQEKRNFTSNGVKLSSLQKYILKQCILSKDGSISKNKLEQFYADKKIKPKAEDQVRIITKSVDRLIYKDLVIGSGVKTAHRWYIKNLKLTNRGKKEAKKLFGTQQKLPFNKKLKNNK